MRFIDNAGQLWHRFWSVRFSILAGALQAASVVVMIVAPAHQSLRFALFAGFMAFSASVASIYARLVAQPALKGLTDGQPDA